MSLETYETSDQLYLARGDEVNGFRPLLTGDVLAEISIPGVEGVGFAIIVAHPCAMRGRNARLNKRVLVGRVASSETLGASAWTHGHYDRMPLPDLRHDGTHYVAYLDEVGRALSSDLEDGSRLACLSRFGMNLLQQRVVWHMTRCSVPVWKFDQACAPTFEEADLLEEWKEAVCAAGMGEDAATVRFEEYLRTKRPSGRTLQDDLEDSSLRPGVRIACRQEVSRIVKELAQAD